MSGSDALSAPPATKGRWSLRTWGPVLGLALLLRLVLVALTPHVILPSDGREYEAVARSLLETHSYGLQTIRAPGYPTLIAVVYWVLGPDLVRLRVVEAVLGTIGVGVIGVVGASLFGTSAGLLAAVLAAVNPVLVVLPSTQYSENTLVLLVALAFAAAFAGWRRGGLGWWALSGALLGAAVLTRPNAVLLLPGLAIGFALALRRERRRWILPLAAALAAVVLVISPWVARNYRVHHRWFFVATGGGRAMWFGNNARTRAITSEPTYFDPELMKQLLAQPDGFAQDQYLYRLGVTFIREHPGRAALLYLAKLRNLFALYPVTYSHSLFTSTWSAVGQTAISAVIFLGAILALALRLRSTPALWPMLGCIVSFALVNSVFWTVMRYRMVFEPCLLWMAGVGWIAWAGRRKLSP